MTKFCIFLKRKSLLYKELYTIYVSQVHTPITLFSSSIYIAFSKKNYKANIVISPHQIYKIGENRLLSHSYPELDGFLNKIENELYTKSSSESEGQKEQYFTYEVKINKDEMEISLSNDKLSPFNILINYYIMNYRPYLEKVTQNIF